VTYSFYLICFGILGCYAGLRTVRAGWAKGLIAIVLVFCLIHLGFDTFYSKEHQADQMAARTLRPNMQGGVKGYVQAKIVDLQADRCVLSHLEETPLSPIAYAIELHSFLAAYKKMQAAQMAGGAGIGKISKLLVSSFGDTASNLSPQEAAAVKDNSGGNIESLCQAFGKWTGTLATMPKAEQTQVWNDFQSTMNEP
jgi:hypothetical protein